MLSTKPCQRLTGLLAGLLTGLSAVPLLPSASAWAQPGPIAAEQFYKQGQAAQRAGRYADAIAAYSESLAGWSQLLANAGREERSAIADNQAVVYTARGQAQQALGQYAAAEADYQQALTLRQQFDNPRGQAITLNALGTLDRRRGQPEQALQHYEQALAILGNAGSDEDRATILNNIGVIATDLGNSGQALRYYEQALAAAGSDETRRIKALLNIINAYNALGQPDQAETYYNQLLEISQSAFDPTLAAAVFNNLGAFYVSRQQYAEALEVYRTALSASRTPEQQASIFNKLGNVQASLGNRYAALNFGTEATTAYQRAELRYQQALDIFNQLGYLPGLGQVLTDLGQLSEIQADPALARDYYQRAVDDVFEAALADTHTPSIKAALADQNAIAYARLVSLLWDAGDYAAAFNYAERAKARAFLDQIAGQTEISFRSEGSLLQQAQSLRAELALLRRRLAQPSEADAPSAPQQLQVEIAQKEQTYVALLRQIERQNAAAADLVSVTPAPLSQLQSQLAADTTLVKYFVLDDRVLAFVVTPEAFHARALPIGREALSEAIQQLYEYDFATLGDPHPSSLQALHQALIAPIAPLLQTSHLTIVPHSSLHYVPFAALTDGQRYLIDRYALTHLPSANVAQFLQPPSQSAEAAVAFSNPTLDLPFASQEASAIAAIYPTAAANGLAATEAEFWQSAAQADILHLATHGEYNPQRPLLSQLLFAPAGTRDRNDGQLAVYELYDLDLTRAQLVVLSACQTQVGQLSRGDEIVSLNRAFLFAGTPNVIATLWNINDDATAYLMERFYTYLLDQPVEVALQQAQADTRQQYPHPYHWAAFVLTGSGG
ncbi:MAG: CHAT domain-containing protein [Leptolyngbya sp. SIO4C1]|nr:CHAT domain-containing protein [Leptolyngbya sp. SIO4C1]